MVIQLLAVFGLVTLFTQSVSGEEAQISIETKLLEFDESLNTQIKEKFYRQGALNQSHMDAALKEMASSTGVDLLSAPKVTSKQGESARISVARDFISASGFKQITPAKKDAIGYEPVGMETNRLGFVLDVKAGFADKEQHEIHLDLKVNSTEFLGFVPAIQDGKLLDADAARKVVSVSKSEVNDPKYAVFDRKSVATKITVYSGSWVNLGGFVTQKTQADVLETKRSTYILVKAEKIDLPSIK